MTGSTTYLAYGSNLWLHQMATRCPSSPCIGVARLPSYRWLINSRGYANIVETPSSHTPSLAERDYASEVWGLVYALTPADERQLDRHEGVPEAYAKESIHCAFWEASANDGRIDVSAPSKEVDMLVYVDRQRVEPSVPRAEYVVRMNHGIDDALDKGVPSGYVKRVLRRFIPEGGGGEHAGGEVME